MINTWDRVLTTEEFGGLEVPPGAEVEIEDGYCDARLAMNGERVPSLVERLAAGLKPADAKLRKAWGKHLRLTAPPTAPEAARLAEEGMPPAVTAMVESGLVDPPKRRRKAAV